MFSNSTKFLFSVVCFLGLNTALSAQECRLNCQDHVSVALDSLCQYTLGPADVLKNPDCPLSLLDVELYDPYGVEIPNALMESHHRGLKLVYKVIQTVDGTDNSCWGYVTPEDKWAPLIECVDDTLNCWDAQVFLDAFPEKDNCGYSLEFQELGKTWVDFDCQDSVFVGYIIRSVISTDTWGNVNRCDSQRIYILREYIDSLVCPDSVVTIECCDYDELDAAGNPIYKLWDPKYAYEDADGYAHPIPKPGGLVLPPYISTPDGPHYISKGNAYGKCNLIADYKDHIIPTCGSSYKIRREYKIYDWCTNRDTTCIQWIKILDTLPPVVMGPGAFNTYKDVCLDYLSNFDLATEPSLMCSNSYRAVDLTDYNNNVYYVKPHDCVAHVELERPMIKEECGFKFAKGDSTRLAEAHAAIKVSYLIRYEDKEHPGKEYTLTGDIPYGEKVTVYLPAGWHTIFYFIKDECWNEAYACKIVGVRDIIPPTPVCDEITQVTLDPEYCWTRIYAKDLDDGSNDNCSYRLHFAVAAMDSIEHYRSYWEEQLIECVGEYDYNHYKYLYDELVERWINCYLFNDYIDVSECGTEMLVLRVYEADGFPVYDPHKFAGTEHQWFCFSLYDDYSCFYKFNYDKFANYENPKADLCEYELVENEFNYPDLINTECQCFAVPQPISSYMPNECIPCEFDQGIITAVNTSELIAQDPFGDEFYHGPFRNRACCKYEIPSADSDYLAWLELLEKYPHLSRLDCSRYQFQHLYNDCMIEVIKDDKTPPVCIPPASTIYYCDGVPYSGSFYPNGGNDIFCWDGARFAHDICIGSDIWDSKCRYDDHADAGTDNCIGSSGPQKWCIAAPWDGKDHGYYGGPSMTGYSYEDPCGVDHSEWFTSHKPIYCRFWLMLDRYDLEDGQTYDPYAYFGELTVVENCWKHQIDTVDSGELDECGVGILTRTWTVTDNCGNTSSCYQQILVKPRSDFEVKFPEDKEVDCEELSDLSPLVGDENSYPVVSDNDCELIGITYSDQILEINELGCYKILRTWKIIDWCVYTPDVHYDQRYPDVIVDDRCVAHVDKRPCVYRNLKDDGDGFMTYLQVLTVVDDEAPVVSCEDIEICIYDDKCDALMADDFIGEATDNCTEELQYRYTIMPFGSDDESTWVFGLGNSVQNTLPVGEHTGILYARDDCGNEGYCEFNLVVKDCKKPTPYCYNGIATVIMPSSGEVTVWARDLDAGSFDNCTESDSLVFTFDEAGEEPSITLTCDDLQGGTSSQVEVEIWVMDEAGNSDFCITYILLQTGSDSTCADISTLMTKEGKKDETGIITDSRKNPNNGGTHIFGIRGSKSVNGEITLHQNRPNPYQFNTIVEFELPSSDLITLRVMDITGKVLMTNTANYSKGLHQWKIDKDLLGVSAGILYYQLTNNERTLTRKMVIVE